MKLETIYDRLKESIENNDLKGQLDLLNDIAKQIRLETCYKTTSKTRINAIKRVASKNKDRLFLSGYGIYEDYKVITDSYHLVAIKQDEMPLKLTTTDEKIIKELGKDNCIIDVYPNVERLLKFDEDLYNLIDLDINDVMSFYKLHNKKATNEPYNINNNKFNIKYLKNVIDVLGTNIKVYVAKEENSTRPIYIINDKNEIGLIVPIKTF